MNKICLFFVLLFLSRLSFAIADWTMYVYMQADNDLSSYAQLDLIEEMAKSNVDFEKVKVFVECDVPSHTGTKRYEIKKGEAVLVETLSYEMGRDPKAELVRGFRWAISSGPAKYYAISLWGHGTGIIDPLRNIAKGILFDYTNDTYLNNQELAEALHEIKTEVLGGRNIDVVGMDSCLMGGFEVAYQIKDSVDYFVASQQTEPAKGWYYKLFLEEASSNRLTPFQFAKSIVDSYEYFYSLEKTNNYTQSAIDLSKIDLIYENLYQFVSKWDECESLLSSEFKSIVKYVRNNSSEFDFPDFIDLYSFYKDILEKVEEIDIEEFLEQQSHPRPINGRPGYSSPIIFSRPNLLMRPYLNRPSSNSRPSTLRPIGVINQHSGSHTTGTFSRPTNFSIHYRPRLTNSTNLSRPKNSRPINSRPNRPVISFRKINIESLRLSNAELRELSKRLRELKLLLSNGLSLIERSVIANTCGSEVSWAKGISIYFPTGSIDNSYLLTNFAIDGNWVSFLNKFV